MTKKPEQQDLIPDLDNVPAVVKRAATAYKNASEEKSAASDKHKAKKANLIALMEEHDVPAVAVELGGVRKMLVLSEEPKISTKPIVKSPEAEEADA
jgi:hypothetical protein